MATGIKRTAKAKSHAIVSDTVKDYGNEPYFVKRAKESKAFPEKHGFPKETAQLAFLFLAILLLQIYQTSQFYHTSNEP